MRIKILSFIYSRKNNRFLLLKNNGEDPIHGGEKWFTVTGSVEKEDKSLEDAVARKMLEEIDIAPIKIINLNTKSEYYSNYDKEQCEEHNFLSIINSDKVILDGIEHIDFLWCDIDEYIEKLWWDDNKESLKKKLETEINNLNITKENIDIQYLPYGSYVEVYILNENKEFIVVFSALKDHFCKVLGGGLEKDETFEKAAIREAKEEVNADIEIIGISKYPLEYEISKESLFNNYFKSRGGKGKIVIAKLLSSPENIKIQEEEISGYKWIKKEETEKCLTLQNQIESARKIFEEFKELF
ncbi:MAG TPA: NUDIX domain-containing protein [archaeon]|nr:NUDIX domain-containing protein [archaeon]